MSNIMARNIHSCHVLGFPCGSDAKGSACNGFSPGFSPWFGKILWRREWQANPVFLPGEFRGQRSLGATVHGVKKSQTWLNDYSS